MSSCQSDICLPWSACGICFEAGLERKPANQCFMSVDPTANFAPSKLSTNTTPLILLLAHVGWDKRRALQIELIAWPGDTHSENAFHSLLPKGKQTLWPLSWGNLEFCYLRPLGTGHYLWPGGPRRKIEISGKKFRRPLSARTKKFAAHSTLRDNFSTPTLEEYNRSIFIGRICANYTCLKVISKVLKT